MSDERGTMSIRRDRVAESVETMLKLHRDLPQARTPRLRADGLRLTAYGQLQMVSFGCRA
jgi:hypothetical protein